ncbi:hypothetical protein [Anabaena catenula]|uniref:Uncharacterized protein n=1 Tax=Anabaena catenula FACHB-362 TaxID=2692877 RepID=A0ABR8J1S0_9NOST|nr:hypothetical protein [Anabaena catenula]MBD2692282.1 hypothetical protein [Anabaena catenula FACHB-362]
MLPTLEDFGVQTPAYIRKINKLTHWHPENCNSQQERAQKAAIDIFDDGINSLYLVKSDQDFYATIVAISANRTPKDQNFDFIWITQEELQEVGIKFELVIEGACLHSQKLHFNASLDTNTGCKLCENIMSKNREAKRCKKKNTMEILNHLKTLGCKALVTNSPNCKCENQN